MDCKVLNLDVPLDFYVRIDHYQFRVLKHLYQIVDELYRLENWKMCYKYGSMYIKQFSILISNFYKYMDNNDKEKDYDFKYLDRLKLIHVLKIQSVCSEKTCSPFILLEMDKINRYLDDPINYEPDVYEDDMASNLLLSKLQKLLADYINLQVSYNRIYKTSRLDERIIIVTDYLNKLRNKYSKKINLILV